MSRRPVSAYAQVGQPTPAYMTTPTPAPQPPQTRATSPHRRTHSQHPQPHPPLRPSSAQALQAAATVYGATPPYTGAVNGRSTPSPYAMPVLAQSWLQEDAARLPALGDAHAPLPLGTHARTPSQGQRGAHLQLVHAPSALSAGVSTSWGHVASPGAGGKPPSFPFPPPPPPVSAVPPPQLQVLRSRGRPASALGGAVQIPQASATHYAPPSSSANTVLNQTADQRRLALASWMHVFDGQRDKLHRSIDIRPYLQRSPQMQQRAMQEQAFLASAAAAAEARPASSVGVRPRPPATRPRASTTASAPPTVSRRQGGVSIAARPASALMMQAQPQAAWAQQPYPPQPPQFQPYHAYQRTPHAPHGRMQLQSQLQPPALPYGFFVVPPAAAASSAPSSTASSQTSSPNSAVPRSPFEEKSHQDHWASASAHAHTHARAHGAVRASPVENAFASAHPLLFLSHVPPPPSTLPPHAQAHPSQVTSTDRNVVLSYLVGPSCTLFRETRHVRIENRQLDELIVRAARPNAAPAAAAAGAASAAWDGAGDDAATQLQLQAQAHSPPSTAPSAFDAVELLELMDSFSFRVSSVPHLLAGLHLLRCAAEFHARRPGLLERGRGFDVSEWAQLKTCAALFLDSGHCHLRDGAYYAAPGGPSPPPVPALKRALLASLPAVDLTWPTPAGTRLTQAQLAEFAALPTYHFERRVASSPPPLPPLQPEQDSPWPEEEGQQLSSPKRRVLLADGSVSSLHSQQHRHRPAQHAQAWPSRGRNVDGQGEDGEEEEEKLHRSIIGNSTAPVNSLKYVRDFSDLASLSPLALATSDALFSARVLGPHSLWLLHALHASRAHFPCFEDLLLALSFARELHAHLVKNDLLEAALARAPFLRAFAGASYSEQEWALLPGGGYAAPEHAFLALVPAEVARRGAEELQRWRDGLAPDAGAGGSADGAGAGGVATSAHLRSPGGPAQQAHVQQLSGPEIARYGHRQRLHAFLSSGGCALFQRITSPVSIGDSHLDAMLDCCAEGRDADSASGANGAGEGKEKGSALSIYDFFSASNALPRYFSCPRSLLLAVQTHLSKARVSEEDRAQVWAALTRPESLPSVRSGAPLQRTASKGSAAAAALASSTPPSLLECMRAETDAEADALAETETGGSVDNTAPEASLRVSGEWLNLLLQLVRFDADALVEMVDTLTSERARFRSFEGLVAEVSRRVCLRRQVDEVRLRAGQQAPLPRALAPAKARAVAAATRADPTAPLFQIVAPPPRAPMSLRRPGVSAALAPPTHISATAPPASASSTPRARGGRIGNARSSIEVPAGAASRTAVAAAAVAKQRAPGEAFDPAAALHAVVAHARTVKDEEEVELAYRAQLAELAQQQYEAERLQQQREEQEQAQRQQHQHAPHHRANASTAPHAAEEKFASPQASPVAAEVTPTYYYRPAPVSPRPAPAAAAPPATEANASADEKDQARDPLPAPLSALAHEVQHHTPAVAVSAASSSATVASSSAAPAPPAEPVVAVTAPSATEHAAATKLQALQRGRVSRRRTAKLAPRRSKPLTFSAAPALAEETQREEKPQADKQPVAREPQSAPVAHVTPVAEAAIVDAPVAAVASAAIGTPVPEAAVASPDAIVPEADSETVAVGAAVPAVEAAPVETAASASPSAEEHAAATRLQALQRGRMARKATVEPRRVSAATVSASTNADAPAAEDAQKAEPAAPVLVVSEPAAMEAPSEVSEDSQLSSVAAAPAAEVTPIRSAEDPAAAAASSPASTVLLAHIDAPAQPHPAEERLASPDEAATAAAPVAATAADAPPNTPAPAADADAHVEVDGAASDPSVEAANTAPLLGPSAAEHSAATKIQSLQRGRSVRRAQPTTKGAAATGGVSGAVAADSAAPAVDADVAVPEKEEAAPVVAATAATPASELTVPASPVIVVAPPRPTIVLQKSSTPIAAAAASAATPVAGGTPAASTPVQTPKAGPRIILQKASATPTTPTQHPDSAPIAFALATTAHAPAEVDEVAPETEAPPAAIAAPPAQPDSTPTPAPAEAAVASAPALFDDASPAAPKSEVEPEPVSQANTADVEALSRSEPVAAEVAESSPAPSAEEHAAATRLQALQRGRMARKATVEPRRATAAAESAATPSEPKSEPEAVVAPLSAEDPAVVALAAPVAAVAQSEPEPEVAVAEPSLVPAPATAPESESHPAADEPAAAAQTSEGPVAQPEAGAAPLAVDAAQEALIAAPVVSAEEEKEGEKSGAGAVETASFSVSDPPVDAAVAPTPAALVEDAVVEPVAATSTPSPVVASEAASAPEQEPAATSHVAADASDPDPDLAAERVSIPAAAPAHAESVAAPASGAASAGEREVVAEASQPGPVIVVTPVEAATDAPAAEAAPHDSPSDAAAAAEPALEPKSVEADAPPSSTVASAAAAAASAAPVPAPASEPVPAAEDAPVAAVVAESVQPTSITVTPVEDTAAPAMDAPHEAATAAVEAAPASAPAPEREHEHEQAPSIVAPPVTSVAPASPSLNETPVAEAEGAVEPVIIVTPDDADAAVPVVAVPQAYMSSAVESVSATVVEPASGPTATDDAPAPTSTSASEPVLEAAAASESAPASKSEPASQSTISVTPVEAVTVPAAESAVSSAEPAAQEQKSVVTPSAAEQPAPAQHPESEVVSAPETAEQRPTTTKAAPISTSVVAVAEPVAEVAAVPVLALDPAAIASPASPLCNVCSQATATLHCVDCSLDVCTAACDSVLHAAAAMLGHERVPLAEKQSAVAARALRGFPADLPAGPAAPLCQSCQQATARVHCHDCALDLCTELHCDATIHAAAASALHVRVALEDKHKPRPAPAPTHVVTAAVDAVELAPEPVAAVAAAPVAVVAVEAPAVIAAPAPSVAATPAVAVAVAPTIASVTATAVAPATIIVKAPIAAATAPASTPAVTVAAAPTVITVKTAVAPTSTPVVAATAAPTVATTTSAAVVAEAPVVAATPASVSSAITAAAPSAPASTAVSAAATPASVTPAASAPGSPVISIRRPALSRTASIRIVVTNPSTPTAAPAPAPAPAAAIPPMALATVTSAAPATAAAVAAPAPSVAASPAVASAIVSPPKVLLGPRVVIASRAPAAAAPAAAPVPAPVPAPVAAPVPAPAPAVSPEVSEMAKLREVLEVHPALWAEGAQPALSEELLRALLAASGGTASLLQTHAPSLVASLRQFHSLDEACTWLRYAGACAQSKAPLVFHHSNPALDGMHALLASAECAVLRDPIARAALSSTPQLDALVGACESVSELLEHVHRLHALHRSFPNVDGLVAAVRQGSSLGFFLPRPLLQRIIDYVKRRAPGSAEAQSGLFAPLGFEVPNLEPELLDALIAQLGSTAEETARLAESLEDKVELCLRFLQSFDAQGLQFESWEQLCQAMLHAQQQLWAQQLAQQEAAEAAQPPPLTADQKQELMSVLGAEDFAVFDDVVSELRITQPGLEALHRAAGMHGFAGLLHVLAGLNSMGRRVESFDHLVGVVAEVVEDGAYSSREDRRTLLDFLVDDERCKLFVMGGALTLTSSAVAVLEATPPATLDALIQGAGGSGQVDALLSHLHGLDAVGARLENVEDILPALQAALDPAQGNGSYVGLRDRRDLVSCLAGAEGKRLLAASACASKAGVDAALRGCSSLLDSVYAAASATSVIMKVAAENQSMGMGMFSVRGAAFSAEEEDGASEAPTPETGAELVLDQLDQMSTAAAAAAAGAGAAQFDSVPALLDALLAKIAELKAHTQAEQKRKSQMLKRLGRSSS